MAIIKNTYTGDGSTVLYSFTFPYIKEDDIKVSLDEVDTTAYTLANATTVEFTTAPASGVAIVIYRQTVRDDVENVFFPGSAIRAKDLNDNFTQSLFVIQEADDTAEQAKTIAENAETVADGAVTTANGAVTTADAAVVSAAAANTTAGNAVASAATANTTAANAVTTANSAVTTANTAVTTANTATTTAADAVTTANTAVTTANTANTTAASAVTTANNALSQADTADTNATNALNLVGQIISYVPVTNVAAIPSSPTDGDSIRVQDSTGIESFTPIQNVPTGFTGSSILYVDIVYTGGNVNSWDFIQYGVLDTDARYVLKGGDTTTGALSVPAGATGTQVPQVQEVATLSGATFTGAVAVPAGATGTQVPQVQEVATLSGATFTGAISVPAGASGTQVPQVQEVALLSGASFTGDITVPSGATGTSVPQAQEVATAAQGTLADSAVQPADNVSSLTNDAGYLTASDTIDASTVNSLAETSFIRSDADDNVAAHTEWQDNKQARFGNDADFRIYHNGTNAYLDNNKNHIYIRSNVDGDDGGNIYIQAKSGETSIVCNDDSSVVLYHNNSACLATTSTDGTGSVQVYGSLIPDSDNTGVVGTSGRTWSNGQFTSLTVNSTLSVRGAVDLADNDILRLGSGDDAELFCNGSHLYLDLNSGIGNFYIRDGSTTRYTFNDNGTLTATTFNNSGIRNGYKQSTAGQTGTYAFLGTHTSRDNKTANGTVSGTYLRYTNALAQSSSGTPSGSWRLCGRTASGNNNYGEAGASLYLRYA